MSDVQMYELCEELLSYVSDQLTTRAGDGGPALPERVYVSDGVPAADECEQLCVYVRSIRSGLPGLASEDRIRKGTTLIADITVTIFRCAPVLQDNGEPPTTSAIEDSARAVLSDWQTIARGIVRGINTGDLFGSCTAAQLLESAQYGPEGGMAGSTTTVAVQL